jgi:drug/metabolite transporter (DMT)-like permease
MGNSDVGPGLVKIENRPDTAPRMAASLRRSPISPYLWMLAGSLAFAIMSVLVHSARDACDWRLVAFVRSGLCALFVGVWAIGAGARLVFMRPPVLWLRSICGSLSLVGTFYALPRLPVSDVLTLTNVFPIWVAILSWPILGERPGWRVWLAVACGISGVALIQQPHFAEGNFASLVALACSLSTALAMIGLHRLQGIDPRAIVVHFSVVSMLFVVLAWFVLDGATREPLYLDSRLAFLLLGVGLAASIGQVFLTKAFAAGEPAKVSVVGLSQVVFAMLFDVLLLAHEFNTLSLLGTLLVLAPSAWLMAHRKETDHVVDHADA